MNANISQNADIVQLDYLLSDVSDADVVMLIALGSIIRYRTHPNMPSHRATVCAIIPGGVLIETGRGIYRRFVWDEQIEGMEG